VGPGPQDSVPVTRRRRHRGRHTAHVISIQFILSTRVASPDGDWPDEYHVAAGRLYAMFDAIDGQFAAGQLDDHARWTADAATVEVKPIVDSLASARISAVCEIGFQFNSTTLLCGMFALMMTSPLTPSKTQTNKQTKLTKNRDTSVYLFVRCVHHGRPSYGWTKRDAS